MGLPATTVRGWTSCAGLSIGTAGDDAVGPGTVVVRRAAAVMMMIISAVVEGERDERNIPSPNIFRTNRSMRPTYKFDCWMLLQLTG
jgi:hypothetical protein